MLKKYQFSPSQNPFCIISLLQGIELLYGIDNNCAKKSNYESFFKTKPCSITKTFHGQKYDGGEIV